MMFYKRYTRLRHAWGSSSQCSRLRATINADVYVCPPVVRWCIFAVMLITPRTRRAQRASLSSISMFVFINNCPHYINIYININVFNILFIHEICRNDMPMMRWALSIHTDDIVRSYPLSHASSYLPFLLPSYQSWVCFALLHKFSCASSTMIRSWWYHDPSRY